MMLQKTKLPSQCDPVFRAGNVFVSKGRSLLCGFQPWLAMLGEREAKWWESREQQEKAGT